jgi:predicted phage terminase large subunit-like protein
MTFGTRSIPRPVEALVREQQALGVEVIGPQRGPQEQFLASPATVCIYGGSAGGGKSFALLLDALRYAALEPRRGYRAAIFRRVMPQVTLPGGLWDESSQLYTLAGGKDNQTLHEWRWPAWDTKIKFASMQYEADRFKWQGSQLGFIGFDELTHFTSEQYFYLFSRKRSKSGAPTRIRATTNPDADSWVKVFLAPWVDGDYNGPGGPARSGEIRWFVRDGGVLTWLAPGERHPDGVSVTFIAASIFDNPALLSADPSYLSSLKALPLIERQRLLYGDWSVRNTGSLFKRHWFRLIDQAPPPDSIARIVRYWDLAATEVSETNKDPDWTAGVKVALLKDGGYVVLDLRHERFSSAKVEELIRSTAEQDGHDVAVYIEQEPGSSGKTLIDYYRRKVLAGYVFTGIRATGDKRSRAKPVSSQAEGRNIALLRSHWNDAFLSEHEAFPTAGVHDDIVDSMSGAMEQLFTKSADGHVDFARKYLEARRGKDTQ